MVSENGTDIIIIDPKFHNYMRLSVGGIRDCNRRFPAQIIMA